MNESALLRRQWIGTGLAVAASLTLVTGVVMSERRDSAESADAPAQTTAVNVTDSNCGSDLANRSTGLGTFSINNNSSWPTEVYMVKLPELGTLFRTVVLGPGSSSRQNAILDSGEYAFQCLQGGKLRSSSAAFTVTGASPANATPAISQASTGELQRANNLYLKHASESLSTMGPQLEALNIALKADDRAAARAAWLGARQSWAGLGAAYGSFGDAGDKIEGVRDPALEPDKDTDFSGLGRIEFGLFNGQQLERLIPVAQQLQADVATLAASLPTLAMIPGSLALRAHEILEDTLRDTLSGQNDHGASMAFALTSADVAATRSTVADLAAPLELRRPGFVALVNERLDAADASLAPLHRDDAWLTLGQASQSQRQNVNATVSAALELLADVPQLLALPQGSE